MIRNEKLYRKNAGIVIFNKDKKVLMCRRVDCEEEPAWQFPQGGINKDEDVIEAAKRELFEETGIKSVKLVAALDKPTFYDFPKNIFDMFRKRGWSHKGQMQFWSLFYFYGKDKEIVLDRYKEIEFSAYEWVDLKDAPSRVWIAKRKVYQMVVKEFAKKIEEFEVG